MTTPDKNTCEVLIDGSWILMSAAEAHAHTGSVTGPFRPQAEQRRYGPTSRTAMCGGNPLRATYPSCRQGGGQVALMNRPPFCAAFARSIWRTSLPSQS